MRLKDAIFEEMWPVLSTGSYAPTVPATFDTRGFFRARRLAVPPDVNGDNVPDVFAAAYPGRLMLSEVCYCAQTFVGPQTFTTEVAGVPLTKEIFPGYVPDWVEVLNPGDTAVNAGDYYMSKTNGSPKKWHLPAVRVEPQQTLLLFLAPTVDPALPGADPLLAARCFQADLTDTGSALYLNKAPGGGAVTAQDFLATPSVLPRCYPDVTCARLARAGTPAIINSWLEKSSPGAVNYGWEVNTALALVLVDELPATGLPVPATGRLFRDRSTMPQLRLTHPDPAAVITYTMNGDEPTAASTTYSGPLRIGGTTVLRARAWRTGSLPSHTVTRTYIYTPGVLVQRAAAGVPGIASRTDAWAPIGSTGPRPYTGNRPGVDAEYAAMWGRTAPTGNLGGFPNPGCILDQLESIPSVFLSTSRNASASTGSGGTLDYEVSWEWTDPAVPGSYRQENARVQQSGGGTAQNQLKRSMDVLFRKRSSLTASGSWIGPATGSPLLSTVFPGSQGLSFDRLTLRTPSQQWFRSESAETGGGIGTGLYITDAWYRETQRALGAPFLPKRRWVHVFGNGHYYGVFDLTEHPSPKTIAAYIGGSAAGIAYIGTNGIDDAARLLWKNEVVLPAKAAGLDPDNTTKWNAFLAHIDLTSYIKALITAPLTGTGDIYASQQRLYRNPADGKWRVILWDGDVCYFRYGGDVFEPSPNSPDEFSIFFGTPHQFLRTGGTGNNTFHPSYAAAFRTCFQAAMTAGGSQAALESRLEFLAGDFRKTLECEAMRWGLWWEGASVNMPESNTNYPVTKVWADRDHDVGLTGARHLIRGQDTLYNFPLYPNPITVNVINAARAVGLYP